MAFGMSTLMVGCEPAAKKDTKPNPARATGPGSTTGGGAEVPAAAAKGAEEKPKTETPPAAEEKTETPPAGEEKPKTEN